jgi:uncharacterized protein YndB with AHSA1/START domain
MITLHYSTTINRPAAVVWQTLWNDATYRKWTTAFMEGSYAESTWEEGAKIVFLTPDKNGMYGIITRKVENKEMSFRHLGEIKNGMEEPKDWKDATECYFLAETEEVTLVEVVLTMDEANKEYAGYFDEAFPKALSMLKQLCEEKGQ